MNFEKFEPLNVFGSQAQFSSLGAPPGAAISPQVAELLRDLTTSLGLPDAGVVTPWAGRLGDLEWKEIVSPDTNIATFELTDAKIAEATEVLFGQPLPFVTVLTGELQAVSELHRILEESPYELFETQAVYRQDDSDPVPRILFLHWLRVKDVPDIPRTAKNMNLVASDMHGQLRFSQQVPVGTSTIRPNPPAISFQEALAAQESVTVPVPTPGPGPIPPVQEPLPAEGKSKPNLLGPILVGVAVLAATVVAGRGIRK